MTLPPSVPGVVDVRLTAPVAAPLVLDSPHSGASYPPDFRPRLGPERYRRAEDMDVDVLFGDGPALGLPLLAARFPRIWCDANRAEDDVDPAGLDGAWEGPANPSAKARLGKGLVWTACPPDGAPLYAAPLSAAAVRDRIIRGWRPYHATLEAALAATQAAHGRAFLLNCHSMQSVSNPMHEEGAGRARPDIVLSDRDGATCDPAFTAAARAILTDLGFGVQVNDPYKGAEIVRRHGRPAEGRHALQIEVNRALYMDEAQMVRSPGFDATRARLGAFLRRLRDAVAAMG